MAALGDCEACRSNSVIRPAVMRIDGEALCQACVRGNGDGVRPHSSLTRDADEPHLRPAPVRPPTPSGHCTRGCGKPTHRGQCAGLPSKPWTPARREAHGRALEVKRSQANTRGQLAAATARAVAATGPKKVEAVPRQMEAAMDKAIFEVVDADQVPAGSVPFRSPIGRMGELWAALEAMPSGKRLKVPCRDREHAGYTDRVLRGKAKKRSRSTYQSIRDGKTLFCWIEPAV